MGAVGGPRKNTPNMSTVTLPSGTALVIVLVAFAPSTGANVIVEFGSPMRYLANGGDPEIGLAWTAPDFDDADWKEGEFGVGYETRFGAAALIRTRVAQNSFSVYTRSRFVIDDLGSVENLFFGLDYDDGVIAWINGVEVFRSAEMPAGAPTWRTNARPHESSNAVVPDVRPVHDVSAVAIPALRVGDNVVAIGVWNATALFSPDLVLVPRLVVNQPDSVTRGPYLQMGSSDHVVLRWRSSLAGDSRVAWGDAPGALTWSSDDPVVTKEHVVPIFGLAPESTIYYSVGTSTAVLAGDDDRHFFVTAPRAGTAAPVRIWVLGDSGTGTSNARNVRDAHADFAGDRHTDVWLMLGDNAYPSGTDAQYQTALFDVYPEMLRTTVLWPTLGNHDGFAADSLTGTGPYYDIFSLPMAAESGGLPSGTEAYYSFDHANVHFVCLESYETDRSADGAMLTWLEQDVQATTQKWIIAFWHHPPYSMGSHNSDRESRLVDMRQNAVPILEAAGVDLVLSGHSHSYERSFLIDGHYGPSDTLLEEMILDGGDGRASGDGVYEKRCGADTERGAVYVVAGSSGLTSFGRFDHPAMYVSLRSLGSLVIDVDDNRLDLVFLDDQGIPRDSWSLLKSRDLDCNENGIADECDLQMGRSTDVNGNGVPDDCEVSFRRGDANSDSLVDLSDGITTLNHLFLAGPIPACLDAADVDDDGQVIVTDAVDTFRFLYEGGVALAGRGIFECGLDDDGDMLSCENYDAGSCERAEE